LNWLDLVLIAILLVGAFMGMRTGLIGAAVTALGAIIGWMLAGRFSDNLGGLFSESLSNDTWVTVISYAIIVTATIVVARLIWRFVRPLLSAATLGIAGMVDKLGGVALGLLAGFAIGCALIIAMARFAYNFKVPDEGISGQVAQRIPRVEDTREAVENALIGSAIVPTFIDVAEALPGNALGFVPSDFKVALGILKQEIERKGSS
jgi:uncharacterized membrane protein required for colicin V production